MKKTLLTALICFILSPVYSQNKYLKSVDELKALSEKTARLYSENKITESFRELEKYWPLPNNELITLEDKTIKYLNILTDRFGSIEGYVKIKEETIKDFTFSETYIIKFHYGAIQMVFTYYKNKEGWILYAFKWNDEFAEQLKENK